MVRERTEYLFALCVENKDCEDLEKRKIYQILPDDAAAEEGYLRVVIVPGKLGVSCRGKSLSGKGLPLNLSGA